MALNLPITISTYVQERPVLKNRRQRRAKVVRPDFTPVSWSGRIVGQAVDAPTALPTLPSFPSPVEEGVDATRLADSSLTQAILLDWLGQQPIAFHRIYVDISGSVTAAVWLSLVLSRMSGISSEQIGATGIHNFTLARTQCEAETGLTESEQRKAHRQLVKTPSPTFKLDLRKLTALLLARSEGLAEMVRHSAALAPTLDVQALERQAQARSMRRRA